MLLNTLLAKTWLSGVAKAFVQDQWNRRRIANMGYKQTEPKLVLTIAPKAKEHLSVIAEVVINTSQKVCTYSGEGLRLHQREP